VSDRLAGERSIVKSLETVPRYGRITSIDRRPRRIFDKSIPIPGPAVFNHSYHSVPQNQVERLDTKNSAKRVRSALCAAYP